MADTILYYKSYHIFQALSIISSSIFEHPIKISPFLGKRYLFVL